MLKFTYRPEKAAQAGAHLLLLAGGSLENVRLNTLLYLADRAALVERGTPITGDRMVAMPFGPALGETLECVRGSRSGSCEVGRWEELVRTDESGTSALAVSFPSSDELSTSDLRFLDETYRQFENGAGSVHVPEWHDPGSKPQLIDPIEILRIEGWEESDIEEVRSQLAAAAGL